MAARAVACWTIVCDLCGKNAATDSDYAGMGPEPSEAREYFCETWATWRGMDICDDCYRTVDCNTCGEQDIGWAGNCVTCWGNAETRVPR